MLYMKFVAAFISLALAVFVLSTLSGFFIPLIISLCISFFIVTLAEWLRKQSIGGWHPPKFLSFVTSIGILFLALWGLVIILQQNITTLIEVAPQYQEKLVGITKQAMGVTGVKFEDIREYFGNIDFVSVVSNIVLTLTDIASYSGMIAVYVLFLLIEYHFIAHKLDLVFRYEQNRMAAWKIIGTILDKIQSYIRIKTFVSILTALASYSVMFVVGVDFAGFWAFLIFLLNFIPTIGSIIATIFPCLLALIQFDTLTPFVVVAILLTSIQFLVGNYIEPKIMGKAFNLSGLVIVLSLVIWGKIWGIIGMFLCVPILVMATIILAHFPKTKPIAIMLSQDGDID